MDREGIKSSLICIKGFISSLEYDEKTKLTKFVILSNNDEIKCLYLNGSIPWEDYSRITKKEAFFQLSIDRGRIVGIIDFIITN